MTVWINPAGGESYHRLKRCATRMNKYSVRRVTVEEARDEGYNPCGNCRPRGNGLTAIAEENQ